LKLYHSAFDGAFAFFAAAASPTPAVPNTNAAASAAMAA